MTDMPFSAVSGNASPTFHHSKTADRFNRMMLRCMSPYVARLGPAARSASAPRFKG